MKVASCLQMIRIKPDKEEKKLVKGCLRGDPIYQEMLYRKYAGKMFGVCLRYSKESDTARDLLQDSFIKVFQRLDQFRMEGSLEGWIRTIVVRTALSHFRGYTQMEVVSDIHEQLPASDVNEIISDMSAKDLVEEIRQLPHGYRTIFNLYAIEGYTHREISEILEISEGTSKSQLARARALLKKRLSKNGEEHYEQRRAN